MSKSLDRLTLLSSFARIAERGSISAAGRDLGLSQASISRHLSELEDRLGTRLIERTTHSLALTEAGEAALLDARHILDSWTALRDRFDTDGALSGRLMVFAPLAFGQLSLVEVASSWQTQHPGVELNWLLDDSELNLARTGGDLWIRVGRPKDDRLIVRTLGAIDRLIVATPKLANQLAAPSPDALAALPGISLSPFEGVQIPLAGSDGRAANVDMRSIFRTNNIFASLKAVEAGLGYAVMPRWLVADPLKSGQLVDLLPEWRPPSLSLNACFLPSRRVSRLLASFLDHLETSVEHIIP